MAKSDGDNMLKLVITATSTLEVKSNSSTSVLLPTCKVSWTEGFLWLNCAMIWGITCVEMSWLQAIVTDSCPRVYFLCNPSSCAVFTYGDAMHPSAVTFNPATGKNYTYDANGNMLTRGTQTLTWDIDNRVRQIAISGGGTTFMEYDYSGMRVKKNAPTGITLFPFQG